MKPLENKVAYITGGSKGIGLGVAKSLLNLGMRVAISGRDYAAVSKTAESLAEGDDRVLPIASDVRKYEDETAAIQTILDKWGQLDVLIANAGVGKFSNISDMSLEDWNATIDTNLTGVFHSLKAAIPSLKISKGYIFTIASLAGTNFFPHGTAYNASKFGLVGFTQAAMLDLRQDDIKVSTIMPGSVATYFNDHIPSDADDWKIQPEDIGQIIADMLQLNPRTLPSKVEVRPSKPPSK
ncbi:SDR family oxidoreductase [Membranihabitans marinus]|uniref:SDR family oxidoreductase n=1 Tax=Membranihabitans marinus TaxID=1227546 RepID=UPI001F3FE5E6|nr:SDR family oxidoreductase [Membranihabitans marinus]